VTVIGIDSHKDTLSGVLADESGRPLEERIFSNTPRGHTQAAAWVQDTAARRVAIEGSGNYGRSLALALTAIVDVVDVPPQMTARARKTQRTHTKSDSTDALLIARVGARDNDLPPPRLNGPIEDLRCLVHYRRELVQARTRDISRLHADLQQIACGYHRKITTPLTSAKAQRVSRMIRGNQTPRALIARHRLNNIRALNRKIKDLNGAITTTVETSGTTLTNIHGVGVLVAAEILAEVGDPTRYATKAKFAMANGTAPLQASSGRTKRHRLNRGGNRQLNRAIHTIAITQIARPGTEGRKYYERKLAAGKSKREATRALKRRISDRVWTHLQQQNPPGF